ncbi:MAG: FGGY family carbohydrate kinase, partial [Pseudomonadota bacterium]
MSAQHALGIDIGTSGARATMLSATGDVLASGAARMADHGPDHRDPEVWKRTLAAALEQLFEHVDPALIGALSVDGTSGTLLALDESGQTLG